jgi:hypothetical protein
LIIDIILVIIIAVIALVASRFIPTDEAIKSNQAGPYKSKVKMIYIAGASSITGGVLLLIFYAIEEDYQLIINLGKIVFLMIIGIALINKNFKKSKAVAAFESAVPVTTAPIEATVEADVVTPTTVAPVTPVVQKQTTQATTPQVVQAQPQTAVQPQVAAAPAAPQPKIIVIKCPKCKGAMQINTAMLGQKMKCPHCGVEGRIG